MSARNIMRLEFEDGDIFEVPTSCSPPPRLLICEECGCRVQVVGGKYAAHGIRHPEDSPYCEASGTEPD